MSTLADWSRVHETETHEVWMHRDGYISRREHNPWTGTWRWTCKRGLPRLDDGDKGSKSELIPKIKLTK